MERLKPITVWKVVTYIEQEHSEEKLKVVKLNHIEDGWSLNTYPRPKSEKYTNQRSWKDMNWIAQQAFLTSDYKVLVPEGWLSIRFYRIALEEDFIKQIEASEIPDSIKQRILEEKACNASIVTSCDDITQEGLQRAHKKCKEFLAITIAYKDFKDGKTVYTDYS